MAPPPRTLSIAFFTMPHKGYLVLVVLDVVLVLTRTATTLTAALARLRTTEPPEETTDLGQLLLLLEGGGATISGLQASLRATADPSALSGAGGQTYEAAPVVVEQHARIADNLESHLQTLIQLGLVWVVGEWAATPPPRTGHSCGREF